MGSYLKKLISGGEGLRLDFKYCISDSRKIARTLSAFSNTEGGTLLIGVRDNGRIAGIRSDEEFYMIETAAKLFCRPEIEISVKQHNPDGKTVLEVNVPKGDSGPYEAKDEDGRWKAYFRRNDQNIAANRILVRYWKSRKSGDGILIRYGRAEMLLLEYLKSNGSVTFSGFRKLARIPAYRAEKILVNLMVCNIILLEADEKGYRYILNAENPDINRSGYPSRGYRQSVATGPSTP